MKNQTVETKGRELIFKRTFDASRDLVFKVYTSCEHMSNWWGPRTWTIAECTMDFREGGEWHYCLRGPNKGDESWGKAIYKEIAKPEKITYEDYFSDKDGNINNEMPGMHITIEFHDRDGKTEMVSTSILENEDELNRLLEMGVVEGFTETWDRLEEYLNTL